MGWGGHKCMALDLPTEKQGAWHAGVHGRWLKLGLLGPSRGGALRALMVLGYCLRAI